MDIPRSNFSLLTTKELQWRISSNRVNVRFVGSAAGGLLAVALAFVVGTYYAWAVLFGTLTAVAAVNAWLAWRSAQALSLEAEWRAAAFADELGDPYAFYRKEKEKEWEAAERVRAREDQRRGHWRADVR